MLGGFEENLREYRAMMVENLSIKTFFLFFKKEELLTTLRDLLEKRQLSERFNKELKKIMWKYFHRSEDHHWLDVLQDLVTNINSRVNSSIGMAPDKVTEENSYLVFTRLYGKSLPFEKPKYSVGDRVRLTEYAAPLLNPNKKTFRKGYLASFTKQIFVVTSVSHGSPPMYHLKFGEGEREDDILKGSFYEAEMSRAEPPQE